MKEILIKDTFGFSEANLTQYFKDFEIDKLALRHQHVHKFDLRNSDSIIHLVGKAHDLKKFLNLKIIIIPILN
jgi:transcription termination factor Rho